MLWKDDLLEVVFYPGTDKVEQWVLGPASVSCGDTGSARLACNRPRIQPSGNLTAELQHSIGLSRNGQFRPYGDVCITTVLVGTGILARPGRAPPGKPIPIRKRLRSRYRNLRQCDQARHRLEIRQRINFLPSPDPQHRPAD